MAQNEIHKNDAGFEWTINIQDSGTAIDISNANTTTSRLVYIKDSAGNVSTLTASFVNAGTDGALIFTSTSSTFGTSGSYQLQVVLTLGTTSSIFYSDIHKFTVYPNLI